jgi:predicted DNA-binding protein (MmcQ/YjbR family)
MAVMDRNDLRALCLSLPDATEDFPFGDEVAVFRVAGKIFALLPLAGGTVNLKCDPDRAVDLRKRYAAVAPGWHQNKRHWNTVTLSGDVPDDALSELVEHSYDCVVAGLPRRTRDALAVHAARDRG